MAGLVSRPLTLLSRPLSLLASAGASTGASAGGVNGTATGASAGASAAASAGAPAPLLPPRWAAAWGPLAARRAYGTGPPTPGHGTAVAEEQEEQEEEQQEEVSGVLRRDDEGTLEVLWHGGARRRYPYVWLRDNCVCPDCFLPSAQARRSAMARLDPNTGVAEVAVANSGQGVSVVWPDGHRSDFSGPWLAARCFSAASRAATQEAIFMEGDVRVTLGGRWGDVRVTLG
ncbi:uncharacterized protein LOC116938488 [Petromyzon marinus]|uniref:uncharacterized protein LOC116938488 n=1 Tax=Petromyzon marinus TaxID=7757 RepID=UPI003F6FD9BE